MGLTLRGLRKFKDFSINGSRWPGRVPIGALATELGGSPHKPWCLGEVQRGLGSLPLINKPRQGYGWPCLFFWGNWDSGSLAKSNSYQRKGENSWYDEHISNQNSGRRRADVGQYLTLLPNWIQVKFLYILGAFPYIPTLPHGKKVVTRASGMAKGMVIKKKASPVSRRGCRWVLLYYVVRS